MTVFMMQPAPPEEILDRLVEPELEAKITESIDMLLSSKREITNALVLQVLVLDKLDENYIGIIISNHQIAP